MHLITITASMVPEELYAKMKEVVKQLSLRVPPRVLKVIAFNLLSSIDLKYNELDAQVFADKLIACCGIHIECINDLLTAFKELHLFDENDAISSISLALEKDEQKAKIEESMVCALLSTC